MGPLIHFIIGLVGTAVLFPSFGWISIFFLVTTFGMDIDHLLLYYQINNNISIKGTYNFSKNYHAETIMLVFHTIEVLILLFILGFFSDIFYVAFLGAVVHFLVDTFDMPFVFLRKFTRYPSLVLWPLQKRFDEKQKDKIRIYGACQFPSCTFNQTGILELHIVDGKHNLILCPNHHRMVDNIIIPLKEVRKWLKSSKSKKLMKIGGQKNEKYNKGMPTNSR